MMNMYKWGLLLLTISLALPTKIGLAGNLPIHTLAYDSSTITQPLRIQATTNDPFFNQQTNLTQIKVPDAWNITTGSSDVIIAVIDTGANINHEDLAGRFWTNSQEIPNNGVDDDHDGYVDDYYGYNFFNGNSDITDQNGHGTNVASIIAAVTNNNRGIAGINWNSKIMMLKALSSDGAGDYGPVATAIRYAVDHGAKIINTSFGSYINSVELKSAVDYALAHNIIIVAASGNNNQNTLLYPANYDSVIAVGAVDRTGTRDSFSNYGTNLDVMAPGYQIPAAAYNSTNNYEQVSGTSFASPHVAAIISLMLSINPNLTISQITQIVKSTAQLSGHSSLEYGAGLVDAVACLNQVKQITQNTADINVSPNVLPADNRSASMVTVTARMGGLPLSGHALKVGTTGEVYINENRTSSGTEFYLGTTDSVGKLSFSVKSNIAGDKILTITDITTNSVLGTAKLVFTSINTVPYQVEVVNKSPDVSLHLGDATTLWVDLKNTGSTTWYGANTSTRGQLRLGTSHPLDRTSAVWDNSWVSSNRSAILNQTSVAPGETGRFVFTIKANSAGQFTEYFNPVVEYINWFPDINLFWRITVENNGINGNTNNYNAELISQSDSLTLNKGQTGFLTVTFKNTGSTTWSNLAGNDFGEVRLGTASPQDRNSSFQLPSWLSNNRIMGTDFNIPPNGTLTLAFTVKAPSQSGTYFESFRLVSEYVTWFGPVVTWKITVI